VIRRVLELAVYPCRLIERQPLPRTFMPKVGKPPAFSYLYPSEDRQLLECVEIPLVYRILWGFLAREGCRVSEAVQLRVGVDVDLERGALTLDENKSDDARAWALDPNVARALVAWIKLQKLERGDLLFVGESDRPHETDRLAERLRAHLWLAKVRRDELHNTGTNRRQLRAHDLRGTFVTLSLANGRSETWVADRTGHKSSLMINRYRRAARSATELGLGTLSPLDEAIPELRPQAAEPPESDGAGQPGGQRLLTEKSPAVSSDDKEPNDSKSVAPSGLEPECPCGRRILSPLRLPFRQGATLFGAELRTVMGWG
jgi:integrase